MRCTSDRYRCHPNFSYLLLRWRPCGYSLEGQERLMRYKTVVVSSIVLVGFMYVLPAVVLRIFLPSLEQGIPNPVPVYEQLLLAITEFCVRWRVIALLLMPLVLAVCFIAGGFANSRRAKESGTPR